VRLRWDLREGLVQGWSNRMPEARLFGAPSWVWMDRRDAGRRVKGQSRGTAWRVILQASPITIPSERALNRALLAKGLEISGLRSSLREMEPSWAEGGLIIMIC